MAAELFFKRFRWVAVLCSLGGIYIPGAETLFPFKSRPALYAYLTIFYGFLLFNIVDASILLSTRNCISFNTSFVLVTSICVNGAQLLASSIMLTQKKNLRDLIQLWDNQLQPEIFEERRVHILNEQTRLIWRKIKTVLFAYLLPMLLIYTYDGCVGQFLLPSVLADSFQGASSPVKAWPQLLGFFFLISANCFLHCLFTLFLRLIITELDYLQWALNIIVREVEVNDDGSIELSEEDYKKACDNVQIKLKSIVKHHVNVLRFSKIVKRTFTPILSVGFFALTCFGCCTLYCCKEGHLEIDVFISASSYLILVSFLTSLECNFGENIRDLSFSLGETCFHGNWVAYPLKIQKFMIIIIGISYERPIVIQPFGIFPMLLTTFRKITYMQYQFFRCLCDIK